MSSAFVADGWRSSLLDDLATIKKGTLAPSNDSGRGVPYLGAENLTGAAPRHFMESTGGVTVEPFDVVMLWDGERSGLCGTGLFGAAGSTLARLRAKPGVEARFLYWALNREFGFIQAHRTGTGVPHVPKDLATYLAILLPDDLREQREIVEILDSIDSAIRSTERLIGKLELLKQGLLHDLLTRGIAESGVSRDSLRRPEEFAETRHGQVPVTWEQSSVGECCTIRDQARFPIASDVRMGMRGPFPYYGPTGVLDFIDHFWYDGNFFLIGEDGDHFLKWSTRPMTQLVTGQFNVNNHAHVLQGTPTCLTEWAALFFRHRDITLSLTRQGAGRFKLNQAALRNLWMPLPPLAEQRRITSTFDAFEASITTLHSEIQCLRSVRDGLMDDLLTGRVRVAVNREDAA